MLGRLFLKGLVVVIPAALTLAIFWWLALGAERLLGRGLARVLPDDWYIPGMGLVVAIGLTMLIGLLSHVLIFRRFFAIGEGAVNRLPLVKSIYAAIKDFINYFSPDAKKTMSKVVLVQFPGQHFELIGFVTREDVSSLPVNSRIDDAVAVYLPMSYQLGGFTLILPRSCITELDMTFEEGMMLVLTACIAREKPGNAVKKP